MVTGRPPFVGDSAVSVISQHTSVDPVAPSWHNPDLPTALEEVILRLLEKSPADRFEDAVAVRGALRRAADAAERDGGVEAAAEHEPNPMEGLAGGGFV